MEAPELLRAVLATEFTDHNIAPGVLVRPRGAVVDNGVDNDPCQKDREYDDEGRELHELTQSRKWWRAVVLSHNIGG